jgi:Amt family ammonium transporter
LYVFFCAVVKWALRCDDSLDVFGIRCVGGTIAAFGTGAQASWTTS